MPRVTGTELARKIRARWPEVPIVLATGYAELPPDANAGLPRLPKPYRQEALIDAITAAVGPEKTS